MNFGKMERFFMMTKQFNPWKKSLLAIFLLFYPSLFPDSAGFTKIARNNAGEKLL